MKIFIDLYHLPQYNFYKNVIRKLDTDMVELGCVKRGKLVDVIKHECPEYTLHVFGDYKNNNSFFSMVTKIIFPRLIDLYKLFKLKKYDMVCTAHYQANIIARILRIPNISILDDPRIGVYQILKIVADELFLPPFTNKYHHQKKINALKEWAYLNPDYFIPNKKIFSNYGLEKKQYLFIREVSTKTSNYLNQEDDLILKLSNRISKDYKVVLSLENKELKDKFPPNWIILKEPVDDIHSLMYYSMAVISSGDSMAREGSILGVPSIYCGFRDMPANQYMIDKGMLFKKSIFDIPDFLYKIKNNMLEIEKQEEFRLNLTKQWDDLTEFLINKINRYTN